MNKSSWYFESSGAAMRCQSETPSFQALRTNFHKLFGFYADVQNKFESGKNLNFVFINDLILRTKKDA
jgi:hypothetical protein